jgi:hypothetical protein
MPAVAGPHRSGQAKRYWTHDLLGAWQGFVEEGVDMPELTTSPEPSPLVAHK